MESRAVGAFWGAYNSLTPEVQRAAKKQYQLWIDDPRHPSIRFKKVGNYWSARVTDDFRALGIMDEDTVIWFFIGSHADYIRMLKG
jgi:hypothetical protein